MQQNTVLGKSEQAKQAPSGKTIIYKEKATPNE